MPTESAPSDFEDMARRFAHAGVVVPADRAEGAYAAAQRLLSVLHLLRQPRTAAAEPAHVFSADESLR